jgi:hypothetical protein
MSFRIAWARTVLICTTAALLSASTVLGTGALEVFVGRTATNQLSFHAEPGSAEAVLTPRSVFPSLQGFATADIGFETLELDVPADGLFVISNIAEISLRFVGADAGLTIYNGAAPMVPGSTIAFGEIPFDNHPLFNIIGSATRGQEFAARFVLTDASGLYSDSAEFALLVTPPCPADIDLSDSVGVQDIFDFLALFFQNLPGADFNRVNGVTVQDIFDFLAAFFEPCD